MKNVVEDLDLCQPPHWGAIETGAWTSLKVGRRLVQELPPLPCLGTMEGPCPATCLVTADRHAWRRHHLIRSLCRATIQGRDISRGPHKHPERQSHFLTQEKFFRKTAPAKTKLFFFSLVLPPFISDSEGRNKM